MGGKNQPLLRETPNGAGSTIRPVWQVLCCYFRIGAAWIVFQPRIPAPLKIISENVVESPGIRFLLSHRMSLESGIAKMPGIFIRLRHIVAPEKRGISSSARGIFPLRLGGQAVFPSCRQSAGQALSCG